MLKKLLLIGIVLITFGARSQNILSDKIQWSASSLSDLNHNKSETSAAYFVSSATKIDWVQGGGSYVVSFAINGSTGAWTDLSKTGTINFSVTSGSLTGTITFSKGSNTTVKLVLSGGTDPINISYTISTFQKL